MPKRSPTVAAYHSRMTQEAHIGVEHTLLNVLLGVKPPKTQRCTTAGRIRVPCSVTGICLPVFSVKTSCILFLNMQLSWATSRILLSSCSELGKLSSVGHYCDFSSSPFSLVSFKAFELGFL